MGVGHGASGCASKRSMPAGRRRRRRRRLRRLMPSSSAWDGRPPMWTRHALRYDQRPLHIGRGFSRRPVRRALLCTTSDGFQHWFTVLFPLNVFGHVPSRRQWTAALIVQGGASTQGRTCLCAGEGRGAEVAEGGAGARGHHPQTQRRRGRRCRRAQGRLRRKGCRGDRHRQAGGLTSTHP